jgi:3-oxoacyl-[acyl-carrier-protein] synthase-3
MRNEEFAAFLETSDEWITTRTGIHERRLAGPEETTVSLGLEASRRALEAAGLKAGDLDLILFATVTPVSQVPSNACRIQAGLGCRLIPAFDLNAACTGFLYGLAVADGMIRAGNHQHVLLIGAETLSRVVNFSDRGSSVVFGDGAGAAILSASTGEGTGVRRVRLYADGRLGDLIQLGGPGGQPAWTGPGTPQPAAPAKITMNGREVFRFAVQRVHQMVQEALTDCGLAAADVALVIPHQANQRILDAAFADLGFPLERVMSNIDRYGNTSAASVPIALDEAFCTRRVKSGDTVLLLAFGGGMTWGSAVVTL